MVDSDVGSPPESWEFAESDACISNLMLTASNKGSSNSVAPSSSYALVNEFGNNSGVGSSRDLVNSVDQFLREALQNPRERLSVLRIEQDIEKFICDPNRQELEFRQLPTSYLRLAVHRVAQHYSLQSMVVMENNHPDGSGSRIIVRKTEYCRLPPIRLADIPLSTLPSEDSGAVKLVAIKPRPQKGSSGSNTHFPKSNSLKSVEEREEEYNKARARIFNSNSFSGSEEIFNPRAKIEKEPVAIIRDREIDRNDPDYDRNYDRYTQRFDPGFGFCNIQPMFAPTINYNTEFPELGLSPSAYAYRHQQQPQYLPAPSAYGGFGYGIPAEAMMTPFSPNRVGPRSNNDMFHSAQ